MVETDNKTLTDLESNLWAIKKTILKRNTLGSAMFLKGRELEIESADHVLISVLIHGEKKKTIREFTKAADKAAKNYNGKPWEDCFRDDFRDTPDDLFRFFTRLVYSFE